MSSPDAESASAGDARGYLDEVNDVGVAHGWAFDPRAPEKPLTVELCIDGSSVASTLADIFRSDLASKNIGTGRHGFRVDLSHLLIEERAYSISARAASGAEFKPVLTVRGGAALASKRQQAQDPTRFIHGCAPSALAELARSRRRLAIVAYFQAEGRVFDYHRRLLQDLRSQGLGTVLIRNGSENLPSFLDAARDLADLVLVRENTGLDFSAWLSIIQLLGDGLRELDELFFVNDSVVGPLFPLSEAFTRMAARDCDFWGMTDSWGRAYHLQSYFLCFKQAALRSTALRDYFRGYRHPLEKHDVIQAGEVGLTQALLAAGLRPAAYCTYLEVAERWLEDLPRRLAEDQHSPEAATKPRPGRPMHRLLTERARHYAKAARSLRSGEALNAPHYFWDTLIRDFRLPFVKRELLLVNPERIPDIGNIRALIEQHTDFPLQALLEVFANTPRSLAPPLPLVVGQRKA